jgi:putative oxidoreductase
MDVVFLLGRILFVSPFVWSALKNHFNPGGVEYARSAGAPAPEVLVPAAGVAALVGSASLALGVWADVGALILVAFLVPVSYYMHAYWKLDDPQQRIMQQVQFVKNLGLLAGALIIFYVYNQLQGEAGLSLTDPLFGRG